MSCSEWVSVFFSECILSMRGYSPATAVRNSASDMNEVMDQLASRQLALELQDRRCVAEARRNRGGLNKTLFRSKMLEHRRLQAQMAQLQRYRESALAHMDAVSNHEINQTFVRAIQGTVSGIKVSQVDVSSVVEDLQESISGVKEISDLLGQPLAGAEEVTDEDLENEFMEFTSLETITEAPSAPVKEWVALSPTPPAAVATQPMMELRTAVFERGF
jgi:DNA-binding NarL/FixJ family response regulator